MIRVPIKNPNIVQSERNTEVQVKSCKDYEVDMIKEIVNDLQQVLDAKDDWYQWVEK